MHVRVNFGDSILNNGWSNYLTLPSGQVLRTFVVYLIAFCSRPDASSDVISSLAVLVWYICPCKIFE